MGGRDPGTVLVAAQQTSKGKKSPAGVTASEASINKFYKNLLFLKKKKQKDFCPGSSERQRRRHCRNRKKFLLIFLKKKHSSLLTREGGLKHARGGGQHGQQCGIELAGMEPLPRRGSRVCLWGR
ncbi:MAG: hypothetical protein ACP5M5_09700 [Acidibrevibacterium sp.]|uniref:hypothetical protein n=1 Tax=Acidibrevibacterium sp. TaxID=2606776 RepID=UPI003D0114DD